MIFFLLCVPATGELEGKRSIALFKRFYYQQKSPSAGFENKVTEYAVKFNGS